MAEGVPIVAYLGLVLTRLADVGLGMELGILSWLTSAKRFLIFERQLGRVDSNVICEKLFLAVEGEV